MTPWVIDVAFGALAGAAFGAIYLGLLWVAVRSLTGHRSGVRVFIGLGLARVALLLGALAAAATLGVPVLGIAAAVVGFIAVRLVAVRWLGSGTPEEATWR